VTVTVRRPSLNLTYTPTFVLKPNGNTAFDVDIAKIIRQTEQGVGADTYEVDVASTPTKPNVYPTVPICFGHAHATLTGTKNAVIHRGVDTAQRPTSSMVFYTTPSHLSLSGQNVSSYTVRIHPRIEGPRCAYTVWVGAIVQKDPSNTFHLVHPASGQEPAAEFDIDGIAIGHPYQIHVHSKPEDAANGPPCMGEFDASSLEIKYKPPPGGT